MILLLAAIGGYLYWQNRQQEQAAAQGEELSQIITDIGDGNVATAPARLDAMAAKGNDAYRASALLTRAALAIQQRDLKLAAAKYKEVAADDGLPQPYRDLATVRAHRARIRHDQARGSRRAAAAAGQARQSVVRKRRRDDRDGAAQAEPQEPKRAGCSPRSPPTSTFPKPFAAARSRSPDRLASTLRRRCRPAPFK